ncbi:MAG TPA: prepilin-type N-terminal cleavage/methylation domain-containing protein [Tepidisphaeraceae bacterium]|jgi:prepilin-type N-terminal cleavage/methylation domain-containing protein/prepilin-type processing-associated H-X9-DG protein
MGIARWRRWQWIIAGICCGLLVAYFYGRPGVPTHARRISVADFEDLLTSDAISHVYVYPPHEDVYLLVFPGPSGDGAIKNQKQYMYAQTPFVTDSEKEATVLEYLQHATALHPHLRYSYLWWTSEPWRYTFFACGFALLIGGAWGSIARKLLDAGYGPPEPAYDLSRFGKYREKSVEKPVPSPEQAARLNAVNAELEKELVPMGAHDQTVALPVPEPVVKKLSDKPLEQLAPEAHEDKEYRGEFYPTARGPKSKSEGFSLVELLVVIGIIALLISILLPIVNKARQSSTAIACASNLRQIGAGLAMYLIENQNTFPCSYLYVGHSIVDGVQTPNNYSDGYVHWSSYLYGTGKTPAKAFQCPAMYRGGLPPTDTTPDNLDPGQIVQNPGVVDQQAPRVAYTLNEVLCPRNKFVIGFQGAQRIYVFVKANQVANASGTILCTEWVDSGRVTGRDLGSQGWVMSHRPVHGFIGSNGGLDMYSLPPGSGFRRVTRADLDPDPLTQTETSTRLDWVGRNHGQRDDYPDHRRTNFLYVDGHVVTKSIYDTFTPFEWGEKFYSLSPNDDLISQ